MGVKNMDYKVLELLWDENFGDSIVHEFSSEELAEQFIDGKIEWCKKECEDNNIYYKYEDDGVIATIDCRLELTGMSLDRLWIDTK